MAIGIEHIAFGDEIVAATEFKKNLRYWLNRAREIGGLTITQGSVADLVLVGRDDIRLAYEALYCQNILAGFLAERFMNLQGKSLVFPWLKHLSDEERKEFENELIATYAECVLMRDWSRFTILLDDWKATAETIQNAEVMEAWRTRGQRGDYASSKEGNKP